MTKSVLGLLSIWRTEGSKLSSIAELDPLSEQQDYSSVALLKKKKKKRLTLTTMGSKNEWKQIIAQVRRDQGQSNKNR